MLAVLIIICVCVLAFLVYASACISSGVYVKAACREDTAEKRVYLTFDDGPSGRETEAVLGVLEKYGARACFFCTGRRVEAERELFERIVAEGHAVGNHSWSHSPFFPFYSCRKMKTDVERCGDALGEAGSSRLFRPPFGVTNPTVARVVKKCGYRTVGWSIRTLDTVRGIDAVLKTVRRKLAPGAIILLHDRMPDSAKTLEAVLDCLKNEGYSFDKNITDII